jgi:hypothetical protein
VISYTTKRFRSCFQQLPSDVQQQAKEAFKRWIENSSHPALRFKSVHPTEPVFSVRVSLGYRALGVREGDSMIWFWIGSHGAYDRLLNSL